MPLDFGALTGVIWGFGNELGPGLQTLLASASNVVVGSNPPYTATDFLAIYPQFGGVTVSATGAVTGGSPNITSVSNASSFSPGQLINGPDLPGGTAILSVGSNALTVSANATNTNGNESLTIFTTPPIPLIALNAYIAYASASVQQARWQELWPLGMQLFIAHYVTLWMLASSGGASQNAAQVAQAGLATGIQTSKSVGDVSVGVTPILIDGWGSWNLTDFGMQFATLAKAIGSGPMWLY